MDKFWQKVLSAIRARLDEQIYKSWFIPISASQITDDSLYLKVPNQVFKNWLIEKYLPMIKEEVGRLSENTLTNVIIVSADKVSLKKDLETVMASGNSHGFPKIDLKKQTSPIQKTNFEDFGKNSKPQLLFPDFPSSHAPPAAQIKQNIPLDANIMVESKVIHNTIEKADRSNFFNIPFNSKYSFQSFVAGPSNNFAAMAAKAVGENPARTYNPLFIYGKSGLGKTHLLHAIGLQLRDQHNLKKIIFKSAERFVNELISCLRHQKMNEFHNTYRNCDALLIDDIQLIKGKETTQEEFFHTFNALHQNNKQIVITSDQIPESIPKIDDRLRSRFKGGLIADIQPPDFEHRMAILLKKIDSMTLRLDNDIVEYIAINIKANVRELEGALNRLSAFHNLTANPITIETSIEVLKNLMADTEQPRISIELIQKVVGSFFSIKISELKSDTKAKNVAVPRQIGMFLCKELLSVSFNEIGERFGGKDHSTVMYSVKKIRKHIKTDPDLQHTVNLISRQLKEGNP